MLTIVAYIPALSAGYIWDDDYCLNENPIISAPDGLQRSAPAARAG